MFKFKPDMYKKDIYEINYEKLQDLGIKYLFFDLDNTIITYKENMPNDKIMTDVIGAKRNNLFVIFVDKLDEYEPIRTKFCRFFEGFVLRNFNKKKILEKGKYYD